MGKAKFGCDHEVGADGRPTDGDPLPGAQPIRSATSGIAVSLAGWKSPEKKVVLEGGVTEGAEARK